MPNTTTPPDENTSFMRLPNEGVKAWQAFMIYRDMGPDRTLRDVSNKLRKSEDLIWRWSSQWEWVKRARAFDQYNESLEIKQAQSSVPLWEQRRQEVLEKNWERAERLWSRVEAMLKHPLTVEVYSGKQGTVEVHPNKWNYSSLAQIAKVAAELQAATVAEALPTAQEEAFDVETATLEELREFVARHSKRREGG
jgi:hypothetical protein